MSRVATPVLFRIFGARRFADLQRQTRPAITPPSTSWIAPVVQLALSDKRNTMWLARSSGRPTRPIGWNALNPSVSVCSTLSGSMNALKSGVSGEQDREISSESWPPREFVRLGAGGIRIRTSGPPNRLRKKSQPCLLCTTDSVFRSLLVCISCVA